jgi:hypothetical protein
MYVISLGAGVQSSVMALMAAKGEIGPMPEHMIFSDTQWEPQGVYDHLDWLEGEITRLSNGRMQLHRVTAGNIREDALAGTNTTGQRFASIPFFTDNDSGTGGVMRRQCTNEYKIQPVRKKIRELLGVGYRKRVPKGVMVEQWIGISTDEAMRMKPAQDKWLENRWPLIEESMSRQDCLAWFERNYPGRKLAKSSCIGCPFHNDGAWRDMKLNDPLSWNDAVEFDKGIRKELHHNAEHDVYLHRSRQPLDEVDLRNLEDMGQMPLEFGEECEGMCGV